MAEPPGAYMGEPNMGADDLERNTNTNPPASVLGASQNNNNPAPDNRGERQTNLSLKRNLPTMQSNGWMTMNNDQAQFASSSPSHSNNNIHSNTEPSSQNSNNNVSQSHDPRPLLLPTIQEDEKPAATQEDEKPAATLRPTIGNDAEDQANNSPNHRPAPNEEENYDAALAAATGPAIQSPPPSPLPNAQQNQKKRKIEADTELQSRKKKIFRSIETHNQAIVGEQQALPVQPASLSLAVNQSVGPNQHGTRHNQGLETPTRSALQRQAHSLQSPTEPSGVQSQGQLLPPQSSPSTERSSVQSQGQPLLQGREESNATVASVTDQGQVLLQGRAESNPTVASLADQGQLLTESNPTVPSVDDHGPEPMDFTFLPQEQQPVAGGNDGQSWQHPQVHQQTYAAGQNGSTVPFPAHTAQPPISEAAWRRRVARIKKKNRARKKPPTPTPPTPPTYPSHGNPAGQTYWSSPPMHPSHGSPTTLHSHQQVHLAGSPQQYPSHGSPSTYSQQQVPWAGSPLQSPSPGSPSTLHSHQQVPWAGSPHQQQQRPPLVGTPVHEPRTIFMNQPEHGPAYMAKKKPPPMRLDNSMLPRIPVQVRPRGFPSTGRSYPASAVMFKRETSPTVQRTTQHQGTPSSAGTQDRRPSSSQRGMSPDVQRTTPSSAGTQLGTPGRRPSSSRRTPEQKERYRLAAKEKRDKKKAEDPAKYLEQQAAYKKKWRAKKRETEREIEDQKVAVEVPFPQTREQLEEYPKRVYDAMVSIHDQAQEKGIRALRAQTQENQATLRRVAELSVDSTRNQSETTQNLSVSLLSASISGLNAMRNGTPRQQQQQGHEAAEHNNEDEVEEII